MPRRRRLREFSLRDILAVGLPGLLVIGLAFWAASRFIQPAPPDFLVMTSGAAGGAYQAHAARYAEILARDGVRIEERASAGSVENLRRLEDPDGDVDAGFVQSGIGIDAPDKSGLVALGSLYYEPMWVFYRGRPGVDRLDAFRGKRIAVGPEGSGTRRLALTLLEAHGLTQAPSSIQPLSGMAAADALAKGQVDAVFAVGALHSSAIWAMMYTPGVHLMDFSQAEAYTRRFRFLSKLSLPRGAVDLERNVPDRDLTLVGSTATLVVKESLHPALAGLMLQAMTEIHRDGGIFEKPKDFPSPAQTDFPLASQAERYFKSGPPLLQRYLPFWAAVLIERLWVMLLPLLGVLVPVFRYGPTLYGMRVQSRIHRTYGELKMLEHRMVNARETQEEADWAAELDRIEAAAYRIPVPKMFASQLYTLRQHIDLVRKQLERQRPPAES